MTYGNYHLLEQMAADEPVLAAPFETSLETYRYAERDGRFLRITKSGRKVPEDNAVSAAA